MSAIATLVPLPVLEHLDPSARVILGGGIAMGMITAFVLNLVMPQEAAARRGS